MLSGVYSALWETCFRGRICYMKSQTTQANMSHLNPLQAGQYLIYLPLRDGRLSWLHSKMVYLFCRQSPI